MQIYIDNDMNLNVDLFTSLPTGDGVTATFAMGFGYWSNTMNMGGADDEDISSSMITLPAVNLGVEADVTDWATVRFGLSHAYVLSGAMGEDFTWTKHIHQILMMMEIWFKVLILINLV